MLQERNQMFLLMNNESSNRIRELESKIGYVYFSIYMQFIIDAYFKKDTGVGFIIQSIPKWMKMPFFAILRIYLFI